jgi:hypothetical protein
MTRKVIHLGHHIWFVVHLDLAGKIEALEEHDWREGGGIEPPKGETYDQLFERRFKNRWGGTETQRNELFGKALAFLKTAEEHVNLVDN